jgi:alginate O-acetyltransferase complex protein AlgI
VAYLAPMFGVQAADPLPVSAFLNGEVTLALLVALPASLPIAAWFTRLRSLSAAAFSLGRLAYVAAVFVLAVMYLTADTYNPFIYFRF